MRLRSVGQTEKRPLMQVVELGILATAGLELFRYRKNCDVTKIIPVKARCDDIFVYMFAY